MSTRPEFNTDAFKKGLAIRRAVVGDAYVERSLNSADDLTAPLQKLVTEYCWGEVWSRPGLERRERSFLNLAMLIAGLLLPVGLWPAVQAAEATAASAADTNLWGQPGALPADWQTYQQQSAADAARLQQQLRPRAVRCTATRTANVLRALPNLVRARAPCAEESPTLL